MEPREIIFRIKRGLNKLFENDSWLIKHDLSEQCISHKLAEYIQFEFSQYNVDCEYNGNIDNEGGRKRIIVIKEQLKALGLLNKNEENLPYNLLERAVFPDIIVHKRGTNKNNLCVLEVKKTTSRIPFDYDKIKLSSYTTNYYENDLKYDLGIFMLIETGNDNRKYDLLFFKDGENVSFD